MLGPVTARTLGDATATAHRRPYYVEFLAYLALHPKGVTAEKLAEDLCIRPQKARSDLSIIRKWLGQSRAGKPYLPRAQQTHQDGVPATYALDGVLCDLDLFRRLRARGQSRGADGMADLVSALHLVSGEPFTDLRKDGWGWLLEGDRLDHIMTAAIVDVGHIVTTHALAVGDLDLADFASNVALAASPYDEIATLDRVAVERAPGNVDGADARLRNEVFNRSDDDYGPIQLPPRTTKSSTASVQPTADAAPANSARRLVSCARLQTCGSRRGTSKASGAPRHRGYRVTASGPAPADRGAQHRSRSLGSTSDSHRRRDAARRVAGPPSRAAAPLRPPPPIHTGGPPSLRSTAFGSPRRLLPGGTVGGAPPWAGPGPGVEDGCPLSPVSARPSPSFGAATGIIGADRPALRWLDGGPRVDPRRSRPSRPQRTHWRFTPPPPGRPEHRSRRRPAF